MRSDEVASKAVLNLEYTPSPSLLPVQSQLKVYLNDELMGVPVTKEQLGKDAGAVLSIRYLSPTLTGCGWLPSATIATCVKNPASSTLWLEHRAKWRHGSTYNMLAVNNNLSHFPVPFSTRGITSSDVADSVC